MGSRFGLRHHISGLYSVPGFAYTHPYLLKPLTNMWPDRYPSPSLLRSNVHILSTGILTCYPSATPFGLALGSDLPWAESPGPGTLRFSAGGILALLIATYATISSCVTSSAPRGIPSSANTMLSYHS
jgi:hypothetical protein